MTLTLAITFFIFATTALAAKPKLVTRIAETQVALWKCQDQLGQPRSQATDPWTLPSYHPFRRTLRQWTARKRTCLRELHRVAQINRNLYRLAVCETGGINGGLPLWTHHNGVYTGALGFAHSTWRGYKPDGYPEYASQASPGQQMAVGRILVDTFGGYSSWPACSVRLGLR